MPSKHDAASRGPSSSSKPAGRDKPEQDNDNPRRVKPFLVEPIDDFDFPPELQLPTFDEILEAPVAPAASTPAPAEQSRHDGVARPKEAPESAPTIGLNAPDPSTPPASGASTLQSDGMLWRLDEPPSPASPARVRRKRAPKAAATEPTAAEQAQGPESFAARPAVAPSAERPARATAATAVAEYVGVVFVGDLHLASRVPGFRKDDYPKTILNKLRWVLDYARRERLLPVLLGDVFDFPRDNANWLLVELHQLLDPQTPAIYGNHDCKENTPGDHDTVSILVASGLLRILSQERPWVGTINGCRVAVGGTCWGQKLPNGIDRSAYFGPDEPTGGDDAAGGARRRSYVLWASHHDLRFPGFEEAGRMDCREVRGVDLVVNGHIHRELHDVSTGRTRWMNPGSLTRISRSDASRQHAPGVLRVDVSCEGLAYQRVAVPHQSFDDVFHPEVVCEPVLVQQSLFIRDLAKLQTVRTSDGQGLREFLDDNLHLFEPEVSDEINALADEVLSHAR